MVDDGEVNFGDLVRGIRAKRVDEFADCLVANAYPLIPKEATPSQSFYASEIGYGDRQIYLRRLGTIYTDLLEPTNMLIFDHGNIIHKLVVDMYKVNGIFMAEEFRCFDVEANISGRIDLLIDINSVPTPVEIKSIKKWGFNEICKKGKPLEGHIEQLNVYLKILQRDVGYLHYFCKDDEQQLIFEVLFDKNRYESMKKRLLNIEDMIRNKKMPDKCDGCHSKSKYPATWCQWRSLCYDQ